MSTIINPDQNTVVFDFNGTLYDDAGAMHQSFNKMLLAIGRSPITLQDHRKHFDVPVTNFYRAIGFTDQELQTELSTMHSLYMHHHKETEPHQQLRAGTKELLLDLQQQGTNIIICSNHIEPQIIGLLQKNDIAHYFNAVIANPDIAGQHKKKSKGDRLNDFFEHHGIHNKVNQHNCIIIGDTNEEAQIARQFRIASVAITGGILSEDRLRIGKADHVVHNFGEFRNVLIRKGYLPHPRRKEPRMSPPTQSHHL